MERYPVYTSWLDEKTQNCEDVELICNLKELESKCQREFLRKQQI